MKEMACIYGRYINPKQVVYVEEGKEKDTYRIVTTAGVITGKLRYRHDTHSRDTIANISQALEYSQNMW